jgi:hypothetical protein
VVKRRSLWTGLVWLALDVQAVLALAYPGTFAYRADETRIEVTLAIETPLEGGLVAPGIG